MPVIPWKSWPILAVASGALLTVSACAPNRALEPSLSWARRILGSLRIIVPAPPTMIIVYAIGIRIAISTTRAARPSNPIRL